MSKLLLQLFLGRNCPRPRQELRSFFLRACHLFLLFLPPSPAFALVSKKGCCCITPEISAEAFNLGARPNAELQDKLELLGRVIPSVVVAERVSRKVVVRTVRAACAVCKNVVGLPCGLADKPSTNMATSVGLG